jgi:hypothetical protein
MKPKWQLTVVGLLLSITALVAQNFPLAIIATVFALYLLVARYSTE